MPVRSRHVPPLVALCLAAFVALTALPAAADQTPQVIGTFKDWTAFTYQSGNQKVCYMASAPKKEEGQYSQRGKAWTLVTNRSPGDKGVISIIAGYNYKKNAQVLVTIGGKQFSLFSQGDTGWTYTRDDDKAIVAAMEAGVNMVVEGVSWRGTKTKDTYSLLGFTAAYQAIGKACSG